MLKDQNNGLEIEVMVVPTNASGRYNVLSIRTLHFEPVRRTNQPPKESNELTVIIHAWLV